MRYCKRCLYPENHALNITFDEKGVCSGCRVHEEKDTLDWNARSGMLRNILESYRSRSGKSYDCIIPVSGARDSYFIVHTIKNVYGMNPLLVSYNKHYNTKMGIRNLAYLRTLLGCDLIMQTVSPETVKKITRSTLRKMASMYWHCLAGETVFPVQTAVRFKIPLIIWGAHQGCDQVGMFSHLDEVEMTRKYRKEHDLLGFEAEDLIDKAEGITEDDVRLFEYPHDKELERVGVRGIYLSNYIRWDTKKQHEMMIDLYGYETAPQRRTFDTYNDVDSFHYSDLHDYIKYLKCGYGKVSDHTSREIRLKRLTREEGIELVRKYSKITPDPDKRRLFLEWVGMAPREFSACIDAKRDPRIWSPTDTGRFTLIDSIVNHVHDEGLDEVRLSAKEDCRFAVTQGRDPEAKEKKYVLIGRGWVDGRKDDIDKDIVPAKATRAEALNLKVFILTEGGKEIGLGHVVRCTSLCQAFEEKGIKPVFIVNGDGSVKEFVADREIRIQNWIREWFDILEEIKGADIVIIDSYLADISIYNAVSKAVAQTVYIDDCQRLDYPQGTVLNGLIGAEEMGYLRKEGVEHLLGVRYIPLRREFADVPDKEINPFVSDIMVTFGGDDTRDMTPKVIELLKREFPGCARKVVIGNAFRDIERFNALKNDKTELIYSPSGAEMRKVMLASDIAVSAGGQTLYELARVGIPTVAISVADNQIGNIRRWQRAGFIEYAGPWDRPELEKKVVGCVRSIMPQGVRKEMKIIGRGAVDGRGAARVVDKLLARDKTYTPGKD
jgi:N-acetyl sugar amidotransferase